MATARQKGVERETSCTDDQEEYPAKKHGEVGAGFVGHRPKAIGIGLGQIEHPEASPQEERNLRGEDGDGDVDNHGNRRQSCQQPENQQCPAHDLAHADEGCHDFGVGNADLDESPHAQLINEKELLDAFRKKRAAHDQANQDRGTWGLRGEGSAENSHRSPMMMVVWIR